MWTVHNQQLRTFWQWIQARAAFFFRGACFCLEELDEFEDDAGIDEVVIDDETVVAMIKYLKIGKEGSHSGLPQGWTAPFIPGKRLTFILRMNWASWWVTQPHWTICPSVCDNNDYLSRSKHLAQSTAESLANQSWSCATQWSKGCLSCNVACPSSLCVLITLRVSIHIGYIQYDSHHDDN